MPETAHDAPPIVSVIVPAHNAAAYLAAALESLRTQSIDAIEIVVVDDGSTDATPGIAASFAARDERFRVIRRDVASGRPGCARNLGLAAARGTYVAFLDADDVAVPRRLEVSLNAVRATGATLAFGDFRKFHDRDGTQIERGHLEGLRFVERAAGYLESAGDGVFRCSGQFATYILTDVPAVNTQTFFALRANLASVGRFDESLVGGEDLDLFLRLVEQYPAVYVDEVQTLMRVHATSLTATQADRCVEDAVRVRIAHIEMLRARMTPAERAAAIRAAAQMLADLGYGRWVRGARSDGRAALAASWRLRPNREIALIYLKSWLPRKLFLRVRRLLTSSSS